MELLLRYCQLHDRSDAQVRQIALRFYAFPQSLAEGVLDDPPQPTTAPVPAG
jgi:hypothetical protein